jgi:hypothetical protein
MLSVGTADEMRWLIAEAAAGLLGRDAETVLPLIGRITPTASGAPEEGCGWVLASYTGTLVEVEAIERACAIVQRRYRVVERPEPRSFKPD